MKAAVWMLAALLCVYFLFGASQETTAGQKGKEVTLKGTIMCGRCALKETKRCQNVIQVKENDKVVTYYFKDKGVNEEYHEAICGGDRLPGTVTGVVATKDGKKWITPKKVEYTKK
jgi:hypothetical protein